MPLHARAVEGALKETTSAAKQLSNERDSTQHSCVAKCSARFSIIFFYVQFIRCAATENAIDRNEIIAKTIGQKLEKLQRKCVDEAEKVCCFVDFMADQLTTEHRHLLQDHFVVHLHILSKLLQSKDNKADEFTSTFKKITSINEHQESPRKIRQRRKTCEPKKLKPKQKACIM